MSKKNKSSKTTIDWKKLILAILLCQGAGLIGSIFTFDAIPTWYATLTKPSFSPPNFLFGPVWTTLYTLMGISLYLLWQAKKSILQGKALTFFYIQLFLNTLWSIIFFGFKNPELALLEIVLMWLAIVITMVKAFAVDRRATYLLVPYILWVSFASFLNLFIALLN